jgi:N-acetylglutamate synthase-like GNAT family acetyltransferase
MSIAEKLTILVVPYRSEEYQSALDLRYAIMRKPLGLKFTEEELRQDRDDFHIVAMIDELVIGCLVLTPHAGGLVKMRQVAVAENQQGNGVGKALVEDAEFFAIQQGFTKMYCHARDTAVSFYEKLGYRKAGEAFSSLGIEHWRMEKNLK